MTTLAAPTTTGTDQPAAPLAHGNPEDNPDATMTALTAVGTPPKPGTALVVPRSGAMQKLDELMRYATIFATAGIFKGLTAGDIKRQAAMCAVKIIAGDELGLSPMASMRCIYVFDGQVALAGPLILAQINKHPLYKARACGGARCKPEAHPELDPVTEGRFHFSSRETATSEWEELGDSAFSIEDARRAGLLGKDNWKAYPRQMLRWRALSDGAKMFCPEVFEGPVYTPEELRGDIAMTADGYLAEGFEDATYRAAHTVAATFDDEIVNLAKRAGWTDEMLSAQAQRFNDRARLHELLVRSVERTEGGGRAKARNGSAADTPPAPSAASDVEKPEEQTILKATLEHVLAQLGKRGIREKAKRLEFLVAQGIEGIDSFKKLSEPQGQELLRLLTIADEGTGSVHPRVIKLRCAACGAKQGQGHFVDCPIDETDEPEQQQGSMPADLFNGGGNA